MRVDSYVVHHIVKQIKVLSEALSVETLSILDLYIRTNDESGIAEY